eukprot:GHRQ01000628.1.p1 GENE.GHRQ01000628.1~~GHRQ01000628.1.p1  ORF type:complete len:417 (+),score=187.10 GHRQ01000628.1:180-1430(+)
MHALKPQHVCSAPSSRSVYISRTLPQPPHRRVTAADRLQLTTTAAAPRPCCAVPQPVLWLPSLPSSPQHSRRTRQVVARDSPYREDASSSTAGDDSSRQQQDAHPDQSQDLPAAESVELGRSPDASAGGQDVTVDNLKAVLQSGAATAQSSSPQDAAAGKQAKQHSHKHPKQPAAAGQKLQEQLERMASKYQHLNQRLDSLESTLVSLLSSVKEKTARPAAVAAVAAVGPGGEAADGDGEGAAAAAGQAELLEGQFSALLDGDDDEHSSMFDLKKLQTSLTENINRGYLESVKHLRDLLMAYEWHLHGKELAERRGVALFERHCAEHDLEVPFDTLTALYADPNDLSGLPSDKLKLLARSIIQHAVDERYCSVYYECTNTAKELAHTGLKDVIPNSAGSVGGVIKGLLPLPGFLKK